MNSKIKIVILAAGRGTRMKSELPKALMPLRGKPMIKHLLESVEKSGIGERPIIVVGYKKELLMNELGDSYEYVFQEEQLGTGHAIMSVMDWLQGKCENILVLPSDHPFITENTIRKIAEKHLEARATITLATVRLPDFEEWRSAFYQSFSRILRDQNNRIIRDVQFKDATEEEKEILEVNPIYVCYASEWLWKNIANIQNNNAQKEYLQTDLIRMAMEQGEKVESININPREALAANSKEELEILEKLMVQ